MPCKGRSPLAPKWSIMRSGPNYVFSVLDAINLGVRLVPVFHFRPVCKGKVWLGSKQYSKTGVPNPYRPLYPVMDIDRARYSGLSRKLIVALDIGTTFSGAAYAFLDPDEIPRIQPVTRRVFLVFADLEPISDEWSRYLKSTNRGSAKVPSILYYDKNAKFRGVENGVDFQDDDFLRMRW